MSTLKRSAAVVGVGALTLGLALLGATAAQAYSSDVLPPVPASWYTDSTECHLEGMLAIQGTVQLPPNTADYRYSYYTTVSKRAVVLTAYPLDPAPDRGVPGPGYDLASHYWESPVCPPPEPAPSETPQEVVAPPAGQTTTQSPSKTTTQTETQTAPEVTEEPAPEETTEAPEVTVEATEEPEVQATTATTTEQGVPVGIVVGGLGALAAVGGGAFYAGKRGWFGS